MTSLGFDRLSRQEDRPPMTARHAVVFLVDVDNTLVATTITSRPIASVTSVIPTC